MAIDTAPKRRSAQRRRWGQALPDPTGANTIYERKYVGYTYSITSQTFNKLISVHRPYTSNVIQIDSSVRVRRQP